MYTVAQLSDVAHRPFVSLYLISYFFFVGGGGHTLNIIQVHVYKSPLKQLLPVSCIFCVVTQ